MTEDTDGRPDELSSEKTTASGPPRLEWLDTRSPIQARDGPPETLKAAREALPDESGHEMWHAAAQVLIDREHLRTIRENGEILHYQDGIWVPGEPTVEELAQRLLGHHGSDHAIKEVKGRIRRLTGIDGAEMGVPDGLIPVENGVVELTPDGPRLRDHSPDHRALSKLPIQFDPEATSDRFDEFLEEVVAPDDARVLQEFVGYIVCDRGMPRHRALLLLGEGRNGKSTFLRVVAALVGDDNLAHHSLQDLATTRFAAADLYDKLANLHADISDRDLKHPGHLKALVGGDKIQAERKYQNSFSFGNTAKLIFSANTTPTTSDDSPAFFARWLLVPFPNTFRADDPRTDPQLGEKLTAPEELSGVLNWAIEGYHRLVDQDGFSKDLPPEATRDLWRAYGGPIGAFMQARLTREPGAWLPQKTVHDELVKFCYERSEVAPSKHKLTTVLKSWGVETSQRRDGDERPRTYEGLAWADRRDDGAPTPLERFWSSLDEDEDTEEEE